MIILCLAYCFIYFLICLSGLVEHNVNLKPNVILFLPQKPYFTDGSLRQQVSLHTSG